MNDKKTIQDLEDTIKIYEDNYNLLEIKYIKLLNIFKKMRLK